MAVACQNGRYFRWEHHDFQRFVTQMPRRARLCTKKLASEVTQTGFHGPAVSILGTAIRIHFRACCVIYASLSRRRKPSAGLSRNPQQLWVPKGIVYALGFFHRLLVSTPLLTVWITNPLITHSLSSTGGVKGERLQEHPIPRKDAKAPVWDIPLQGSSSDDIGF